MPVIKLRIFNSLDHGLRAHNCAENQIFRLDFFGGHYRICSQNLQGFKIIKLKVFGFISSISRNEKYGIQKKKNGQNKNS